MFRAAEKADKVEQDFNTRRKVIKEQAINSAHYSTVTHEQFTEILRGIGTYTPTTESQKAKKLTSRTNCKNCGALLQSDMCDYCGTNYKGVSI